MTTPDQIREAIVAALCDVAPETDPATLRHDASIRDQLDIDSMDFLNVVVAVHEALGVDIPESDYGQVETIDDMVAYVAARTPSSGDL